MSRGKVIEIRGAIGYIETAANPRLFFHKSALPPGGVKVGDEVEFDDGMGPKGERAENIRLVGSTGPTSSSSPATAVPAASAATPARAPSITTETSVSWTYGTVAGNKLPIKVIVKRGGSPTPNQSVVVIANGKKVTTPKGKIDTNERGEASFLAQLPNGTEACGIMVQVSDKYYSDIWVPQAAQANPTATPTAPAQVDPSVTLVSKDKGVYTFALTGAANAEVKTEAKVKVEWRKSPCPDTEPWVTDKLPIDADGKLTLELRVIEERAYGDVHFCIGDTFRSIPFFVTHTLPPVRPKPATAPTK